MRLLISDIFHFKMWIFYLNDKEHTGDLVYIIHFTYLNIQQNSTNMIYMVTVLKSVVTVETINVYIFQYFFFMSVVNKQNTCS